MNLKIEFAVWSTEEHLIAQQVKEDDFFIGITYRTLNLFTYELVILLSWSASLIIIFCLCLSGDQFYYPTLPPDRARDGRTASSRATSAA